MTEQNDSVVDKDDGEQKAAPEADDAQDVDIDAYLKEFEGDDDEPQSKPDKAGDTETSKRLEALEQTISSQQYRTDMDVAINSVRGDVDAGIFSDDMIEGWLNAQANRDPRVANAFMKRHQNPAAYKKVLGGLAKQFQDKFKDLPDRQVTEDREAVASAVRGASKSAPKTDDDDLDRAAMLRLAETNPQEFRRQMRELSGKR